MNEVISFIGLGSMGLPIAMNLLESGYKLRVYNRTAQKAQPLVEKGDVELALQTAKESQMPMPLASLVCDRLISAVAKGRGDIDWTGLALGVSEEAGLKASLD